jgi:predicted DNA-binding protein
MNKTNTITVRIPEELKLRIEKISKKQGVSMNHFAMYALTKEAGELEANEWFKNYLKGKNRKELYESFSEALEVVQERPVPDWDR